MNRFCSLISYSRIPDSVFRRKNQAISFLLRVSKLLSTFIPSRQLSCKSWDTALSAARSQTLHIQFICGNRGRTSSLYLEQNCQRSVILPEHLLFNNPVFRFLPKFSSMQRLQFIGNSIYACEDYTESAKMFSQRIHFWRRKESPVMWN